MLTDTRKNILNRHAKNVYLSTHKSGEKFVATGTLVNYFWEFRDRLSFS
jgi:hypothetical protein